MLAVGKPWGWTQRIESKDIPSNGLFLYQPNDGDPAAWITNAIACLCRQFSLFLPIHSAISDRLYALESEEPDTNCGCTFFLTVELEQRQTLCFPYRSRDRACRRRSLLHPWSRVCYFYRRVLEGGCVSDHPFTLVRYILPLRHWNQNWLTHHPTTHMNMTRPIAHTLLRSLAILFLRQSSQSTSSTPS